MARENVDLVRGQQRRKGNQVQMVQKVPIDNGRVQEAEGSITTKNATKLGNQAESDGKQQIMQGSASVSKGSASGGKTTGTEVEEDKQVNKTVASAKEFRAEWVAND
ncbi:hypothetical protein HAX54_040871 [Datura stramonium]|uniref:Uncharacterized protein n=1 Tax=Datura stramonium TaxID=4076 RepID=A0ABS8SLR9_DATST|nr:hypothetical protein [Datura stramonium]